jgi:hypothetical protein
MAALWIALIQFSLQHLRYGWHLKLCAAHKILACYDI